MLLCGGSGSSLAGLGVAEDGDELFLRRRMRRIVIMIAPRTATPPTVPPAIALAGVLLGAEVEVGVGDIVGVMARLELEIELKNDDVVGFEVEEGEDDNCDVEVVEDSSLMFIVTST